MMRVRYTETALVELDQIFSYIAAHSRSAAVNVHERIERTVATLAEIPEMPLASPIGCGRSPTSRRLSRQPIQSPASADLIESEPPMQSDELSRTFTALSPNGKATFLTRITYEQTIHAREAYLNYAYDPTDVDATALRRSNEFIHKLCGYTLQCLQGKTIAEQDASFVAMILDGGYSADDLSRWLGDANNSN